MSNKDGGAPIESAAGSALTQRKSTNVTSEKAASVAVKVIGSKTFSKTSKTAAGLALTQRRSK